MPQNRIIVTGSNGQLGSELSVLASAYPKFDFVFFSRDQFSVNDEARARNILQTQRPGYFINCAAYTAVDRAESEKGLAQEINGNAVGSISLLCKEFNTKFIHISTDYVFNGGQKTPLKETDQTDPVNTYGETKLAGEQLAFRNNPDSLVIRTSWVYSSFGKNFVKTMMRLMEEKKSIGVVNDQFGSPTYAADLAEAIIQIISSGTWVPGIYNFSNDGVISWFDFAMAIRELTGSSSDVLPLSTDQYPTPAKRPKYSVLDKTKIQEVYRIKLKNWKESLGTCIEIIAAEKAAG